MVLPIAVEDVKREVEILKALSGHENVVQFYNAFDDDDYVYIVMEWESRLPPSLPFVFFYFILFVSIHTLQFWISLSFRLCEGGELLDRILSKLVTISPTFSSSLLLNWLTPFLAFRKDSRYSEKDAAVVVRQMLKVAGECHLHGLVHRDMKPEVLLLLLLTF